MIRAASRPRLAGFGSAPGFSGPTLLPDTDTTFEVGSRSIYVAQVQTTLRQYGFDPGAVDGVVGPRTMGALSDAFDFLENSPSPDARATIAGSGSSAAALATSLATAFAWDASTRSGGAGPTPTEPTKMITMGPADAAAFAAQHGLGASGSAWLWFLGTLALGAVGVALARR